MEDGLVPEVHKFVVPAEKPVLILVVVEDGLVPREIAGDILMGCSLNPCCSGRWSRTRPYKTLLIINKLKNFTKEIFTFLNRNLTIS